MRFSPDVALAVSTTPAVLPTTDVQPVGTPFEELPSESPTPEPVTSPPVVTEAPEEPSQRATTISTTTATTAAATTGAPTVATVPATEATAAPSIPAASPATATTALVRTTGIRRLPPLPLTTAATAQATSPAAPSPPTTVADLDTEAPTPRLVTVATSRPGALPRPATTQEPDVTERSTLSLGTTAPGPTELAQVRAWERTGHDGAGQGQGQEVLGCLAVQQGQRIKAGHKGQDGTEVELDGLERDRKPGWGLGPDAGTGLPGGGTGHGCVGEGGWAWCPG